MKSRAEWQLRPHEGHWTLTHTPCHTTSPTYPVHTLCDRWREAHDCPPDERGAAA